VIEGTPQVDVVGEGLGEGFGEGVLEADELSGLGEGFEALGLLPQATDTRATRATTAPSQGNRADIGAIVL
jgi:hypothetical protein